jgi:hypothetical protein
MVADSIDAARKKLAELVQLDLVALLPEADNIAKRKEISRTFICKFGS